MTLDRDYVLGTDDEEIARLGLQHRVRRPRALGAWQRAGFTAGHTILDLGCGPDYAALDLAEIVGPAGHVVAIDRSRRFLSHLETLRQERRQFQIEAAELDLDRDPLPPIQADGAWARWVFAFVQQPRGLVARVAAALKPGAMFVLHEYFDYATWRLAPRCSEVEQFVAEVMASWRASGGEPDVGLDLPGWLADCGFRIVALNPIVDAVPPSSPVWQWPAAFLGSGLRRLVDLGRVSADRASAIAQAFQAREAEPLTHMITPAVLEIIARRTA